MLRTDLAERVSTERERYSDASGRRESELQRSCVSPERERYSDVSGRRDFDLVTAHGIYEPRRQARGSNSW